jgi:hypothetical protein
MGYLAAYLPVWRWSGPGLGMSVKVTLGAHAQRYLEFGPDKLLQHVGIPIQISQSANVQDLVQHCYNFISDCFCGNERWEKAYSAIREGSQKSMNH